MQSNKSIGDLLYWDPRYVTYFPKPIQMMEQNPDKMNWYILSQNPNAIPLLKEELDYDDMKKKCNHSQKNLQHTCSIQFE